MLALSVCELLETSTHTLHVNTSCVRLQFQMFFAPKTVNLFGGLNKTKSQQIYVCKYHISRPLVVCFPYFAPWCPSSRPCLMTRVKFCNHTFTPPMSFFLHNFLIKYKYMHYSTNKALLNGPFGIWIQQKEIMNIFQGRWPHSRSF